MELLPNCEYFKLRCHKKERWIEAGSVAQPWPSALKEAGWLWSIPMSHSKGYHHTGCVRNRAFGQITGRMVRNAARVVLARVSGRWW